MKTFKFEVSDSSYNPIFSDEILITVKSGDFGSHDGETGFVLMASDFLRSWYDTNEITFKGSM